MSAYKTKHVGYFADAENAIGMADEIERHFGFGICVVSLGPGRGGSLAIDQGFPTWERAWTYAREVYLDALDTLRERSVTSG